MWEQLTPSSYKFRIAEEPQKNGSCKEHQDGNFVKSDGSKFVKFPSDDPFNSCIFYFIVFCHSP